MTGLLYCILILPLLLLLLANGILNTTFLKGLPTTALISQIVNFVFSRTGSAARDVSVALKENMPFVLFFHSDGPGAGRGFNVDYEPTHSYVKPYSKPFLAWALTFGGRIG